MVIAVYVSFFAAAAFALIAPACARRLTPRTATWTLTVGGIVTAGGSLLSLLLLALTWVAQNPAVAAAGFWSGDELHERTPVQTAVAATAVAVLVLALGRAAWCWRAHHASARDARSLVDGLADRGGDLTVVDDPGVIAFAVPGPAGRVVVTQGLLGCLDPAERQAVFAHERAHLRHNHHRYRFGAGLAASVMPVLSQLPALVELTTERWADEEAAGVCSRGTVRSALLRVCSAPSAGSRPARMLGVAESNVLARAAALAQPGATGGRPAWRVGLSAALATLVMLTTVAAAEAVRDTSHLLLNAQSDTVEG